MGEGESRLESKLNAILAILVDRHLRDTEIARPKDRSIDRLLTDAGLTAKEIAALLGKTERGVHIQLQREASRKPPRKGKTDKSTEKQE
jgi:IS30 family transposase